MKDIIIKIIENRLTNEYSKHKSIEWQKIAARKIYGDLEHYLERMGCKYPHPIKFGRWILKHARDHFDDEGMLCWKYNGKEYDTDELFIEFTKEEI